MCFFWRTLARRVAPRAGRAEPPQTQPHHTNTHNTSTFHPCTAFVSASFLFNISARSCARAPARAAGGGAQFGGRSCCYCGVGRLSNVP